MFDESEHIDVLGVGVDDVSYAEAVERVEQLMEGDTQAYIVTPNPEMIMKARRDEHFREVLNQADLSVPDGMGVVWASKILGVALRERVAGTDLMQAICTQAARRGWPVFLLGAREGVAEQAAEKLVSHNPGLRVVGTYAGCADRERDADMRAHLGALVHARDPVILFVAFGAPKQELWIARNRAQLHGVRLAMGLGGAFDFIAGKVPRAPVWMRRIGLEWLYRGFKQPWRFRRIITVWHFGLVVWMKRLGIRS
jgi:N-acetylglucosaminyldiphosphoundecaprenol N-acetyl-beta-D-mannosaminyltransferase